MATERVKKILKVRSDFTEEQIANMSDSQAWFWIYEEDHRQRAEKGPLRHEICFTGFSRSERTALEAEAKSLNFEVRTSVTKGLRFLCTGPEAGPAKLIKAREQGTTLLSVQEFHRLAYTPPCVRD